MTPTDDDGIRDLLESPTVPLYASRALAEEVLRLRAEVESLAKDRKLMEMKVITCGVAATNPDANLTLRADYMQWDSPQAGYVRALRAEVAKMRALLLDLDLRGIGHRSMCAKVDETPCDCGADELQRRINEVTT